VNLIVTGRENSSTEVDELRKRSCALDLLPTQRLLELLQQDLYPLLADAIVCFIDIEAWELGSPPDLNLETAGERFAREVRRLQGSCAMLDGRIWRAIPIVLVLSGTGVALSKERIGLLASSESVVFVEALQDFEPTFRAINTAVGDYRQRLLAEFSNRGYVISYRDGRYRVALAMNPTGDVEGFLYDPHRDQRNLRGRFFTVDRDPNGVQYEIGQFEALINRQETNESELQKFFEENPHFLADARISMPLPHVRLESHRGNLLVPDFVIKPIVAYQRDSNWQVLDLKKPRARLLAGSRHVRLSHEVTQAITQLRNYGDYFKNPENTKRVSAALGHGLRYPSLAVLIGRLRESEVEELEKAQSRESDVRIVTYDEILQRQQLLVR
jgi:hypothetical protein